MKMRYHLQVYVDITYDPNHYPTLSELLREAKKRGIITSCATMGMPPVPRKRPRKKK